MTVTYNLSIASDKVSANWTWGNVLTPAEVDDNNGFAYAPASGLTFGTAALQANVHYRVSQQQIAAAGSLAINLSGLTDPVFGGSLTFARMKRLYVELTNTTTAASILVGTPNLLNPTAAPGLAATTGTMTNGTYLVAYTWVNATGETLISPTASVTLSGGTQQITVTPPALPSGATGYNVYCSLVASALCLAKSNASTQSGSTYNITAAPTTTNAAVPTANTTGAALDSMFYVAGSGGKRIRNGMCDYLGLCQDATGYVVGSNTVLNIVNEDASKIAWVNLCIDGCNA